MKPLIYFRCANPQSPIELVIVDQDGTTSIWPVPDSSALAAIKVLAGALADRRGKVEGG